MKTPTLPCPPVALLELATGYQRSKTLFAFVELGVATLLAQRGGTLSLDDIAQSLQIHPRAADRLLNACVALGLLERRAGEEHYRNSALSETFLVASKPSYLGDQFLNYDRTSYPLWTELTARLRQWQPGATDQETPQAEDQGAESMSAQHNLALMIGQALGVSYDFGQHTQLLDLGGGTAAMSIGICALHPHLQALVFDLPEIVQAARRFIHDAGLTERVTTASGNFKEEALPGGFDVALLANLLSVADEQTNRELFKRLYERLPAGGAIILSGWILDDDHAGPLIPLLFCLEDVNWQAADVERTQARYQSWLADAGFVEIEHRAYCPPTSMIVGRKM